MAGPTPEMEEKMDILPGASLQEAVLSRALSLGADLAGICRVEDLRRSPSHRAEEEKHPFHWPREARTVIVTAVSHPEDKPEMDWWLLRSGKGNTPGNEILIRIVSRLSQWLSHDLGYACFPIPYHIERGGYYMKDAAVLAGLGCIGRNNLLVTPRYGPRVRLRLLLTSADLPPTEGSSFDPCSRCSMPCRKACPRQAFPGSPSRERAGYERILCDRRMKEDEASAEEILLEGQAARRVIYCRRCELSCPVGKEGPG